MGDDGKRRELRDGTLRATVLEAGPQLTIALAGELDMANAATLASELEAAEAAGARAIIVDMRELEFIDSTGIAVLVGAHRRLNGGEQERVRLVQSRADSVRRVMSLTGLDEELPFVSGD